MRKRERDDGSPDYIGALGVSMDGVHLLYDVREMKTCCLVGLRLAVKRREGKGFYMASESPQSGLGAGLGSNQSPTRVGQAETEKDADTWPCCSMEKRDEIQQSTTERGKRTLALWLGR
jgi:hypothetical protein